MRVGIPTEIKNNEDRVAVSPPGVDELVRRGHEVVVQSGAGEGSRISDEEYRTAGATIVTDAERVWSEADLLAKVKEPLASEYGYLRDDLVLFCYLHLAAVRPLTDALMSAGTTAVAMETIRSADGRMPLLVPMSEIAGRLSITVGTHALMSPYGGRGMLPGGVSGVPKAHVIVIGGGTAGDHAAANALGMGAQVTVLDVSAARLEQLERHYGGALQTRMSTRWTIAEQLRTADLVIGSVLIPGAAAPKLVTDEMVSGMKPGSVLVDIAIDQGGCFEGSHPTTHDDPTYAVHNSVYYSVANMPGAVPATSTPALTNVSLPYIAAIADRGWDAAVAADPGLAEGLNVLAGEITNAGVAKTFGYPLADTGA